jgi:hypothetical protein
MFMLKHSIFRQFSQILNIQLAPRSVTIGPVVAAVQMHSVSPHSQIKIVPSRKHMPFIDKLLNKVKKSVHP